MKKLIAMISAIAVIGTMSLTSFAEITVKPNPELTTTVTLEKGESGYNASYTSDKVNTQTTIVAVKGAEIKTSSIQYINQLAQDSETVINFDLKDELAAGEIVTVYMGGDAIDKTKIGTIALPFTITFYDEDGTELQKAEYVSGDPLVAPTNLKTEDETHYYEFVGWALRSAPTAVISLPANVTEAAEYVAVYNKTEKDVGGGEDTDEFTLTFLNADGTTFTTTTTVSGAVQLPTTEPTKTKTGATGDKLDWAFVGWYTNADLTVALGSTVATNTTAYPLFVQNYIIGDINGDGNINNTDITLVTQLRNSRMSATNIEKFKAGYDIDHNYYTFNSKDKLLKNGDVNGDGNINNTDITLITQKRNGRLSATNEAKFGLGQKATIK